MKSWKSPFSGKDLDQEELLTELALNVVSKQHILRTCGYPEARLTLAQDSVIMQCEEVHFSNVIPFPSELRSFVIEAFAASYETIMALVVCLARACRPQKSLGLYCVTSNLSER